MAQAIAIDPWVWSWLRTVGVPLILIAFYIDGMIIGKVLPPAALYIAYVGLVSLSTLELVILTLACVLASTLGQWTLYRWLVAEVQGREPRWRVLAILRRIPSIARVKMGRRRMLFVSRNFDRFGGWALGLTNALPGIRSLMTIPAGLGRYPQTRFLLFSTLGNMGYLALLYLIAQGIVRFAGIFPTP